jgi:hypothetical protein
MLAPHYQSIEERLIREKNEKSLLFLNEWSNSGNKNKITGKKCGIQCQIILSVTMTFGLILFK